RKSSVRARSMTSRSILVGQFHSKSAMGLKRLMPEKRRRRSRLRRERSPISAWANCSRIWRGDQRALAARARKSSRLSCRARSPICWSCADRLLLGVVVFRVGELIVGLQAMGSNINGLRLWVAAEIHCDTARTWLAAQQEGDRGGARGVPFQSFEDGAAERHRAVLIQEFEQLRRLRASGLAMSESQVQKCLTLRHGLFEPAARRSVEGSALELQYGVAMHGVQHLLLPVIAARMTRQFDGAIQDAERGVGGHQGERTADRFRRDGVIIEVEAHVDRLAGTDRLDAVGVEQMQGRRQQTRLLVAEDFRHGTAVLSRPAPLMRHLIAPQPSLAIALCQ